MLGGVGALALAAGLWFAAPDRGELSSDRLFALELPDTAGVKQPLKQWRGKILVVNFWATWCEPCREEMPEFARAQSELGPRGVQFVGIAVDQADKVGRFAKEINLNYPALVGGYEAMELSRSVGNELVALPFTIVIDRNGRIADTHLGPMKPQQLRSILDKML
ncbi:MAG TPA: TlpA disulfide reductase family protein [Casimicrobiaceae bacterium]|nr:TlpA disulfide reductase family protein [Casimicrobiaceae bacterium]